MERNHSSERAFDKPHLIYFMHSAFSLLSQMWNFGIALFIASISSNSLFIIALTGFIQNLSIVLLLPVIGKWVDRTDRLVAVHTALFVKVVFITLGFSICAFLPSSGNSYMADSNVTDGDDKDIVDSNFYLYVVCLPIIVAAASLGFYTYRLCIEKDWVIELANRDSEWLANANSVMSQIDLACKSFAPAATGKIYHKSLACTYFPICIIFFNHKLCVLTHRIHDITASTYNHQARCFWCFHPQWWQEYC